jgi:hypothetical protein
VASPLSVEEEIVIPEDTYEHTVAQYWYEALGLAVSEVAFEYVTKGKWQAEVPPFLDRHKIEELVRFHLHHVQDSFTSALGQRLMETDILEQLPFRLLPKRPEFLLQPFTGALICSRSFNVRILLFRDTRLNRSIKKPFSSYKMICVSKICLPIVHAVPVQGGFLSEIQTGDGY